MRDGPNATSTSTPTQVSDGLGKLRSLHRRLEQVTVTDFGHPARTGKV
jgi:hypothetical protein